MITHEDNLRQNESQVEDGHHERSKHLSPSEPFQDFLSLQQSVGNHAMTALMKGAVPPVAYPVITSGGGQPIQPELRGEMESRFGHDFDDVRIHTDLQAAESAEAVEAKAYTVGTHVVFGPGRYAPDTREGAQLLAHELAHVVQQNRGGRPPSTEPGNALDHFADQAAAAVVSNAQPVEVAGNSSVGLAREPKFQNTKPTYFEGTLMMTVELPMGESTPERAGYEKDFHGYLPPSIVEDAERWHASHSVGPVVGVEKEEGILLAPRGVNLSIQKNLENYIQSIRAARNQAPGSKLFLKIEARAHPGTRRLNIINYELWAVDPNGTSGVMLTANVTVSNSVKPQVNVSVGNIRGGSLEGEASRTYKDPFNIRKETKKSDVDPKSKPLRPKSSAAATYSSSASVTKRHEVPNPEVSKVRQGASSVSGSTASTQATPAAAQKPAAPPSSAAAAAAGQTQTPAQSKKSGPETASGTSTPPTKSVASSGTPQDTAKAGVSSAQSPTPATQSAPSKSTSIATGTPPPSTAKPAAPPAGAQPAQSKTAAASGPPAGAVKQETPRAPARGEAIQAGIMLAHSIIKNGLEQISEDKANRDAWNEFYSETEGIINALWDSPGNGCAVEFRFAKIPHPNPDQPTRTEFLDMQRAIGPSPSIKIDHPHTFRERADRDLWVGKVTFENIRRWIPPIRQPETKPSATVVTETPAQKTPVVIGSTADFSKYIVADDEPFFGATLNTYELLARATSTFTGHEINVKGVPYLVTNAFHQEFLAALRKDLEKRLSQRADQLQADIDHHQRRLDGFLQEGWPFTLRRGDITLRQHQHMFDGPKSDLAAARGNISLGAFRHAWEAIQKGEAHVFENFKILYHYEKATPYEGPGT